MNIKLKINHFVFLIFIGSICALSGGCALTQNNAKRIKGHKNPATEFNLRRYEPLSGYLSKEGTEYKLTVFDFVKGDRLLELAFPSSPRPKTKQIASAKIFDEKNYSGPTNKMVTIQLQDGRFDHTIQIDDKMKFGDGYPTHLTLGVYWDINRTGINHVIYTVGYKYAPDTWFVVAQSPTDLEWMNRSHLVLMGYYTRYLYTVPLDMISSPIQLVAIMLSPQWGD